MAETAKPRLARNTITKTISRYTMKNGTVTGGTPVPPDAKMRYGAYLPHLTCSNGIYAVTFRLADSLPQSVVVAWRRERDEIIAKAIAEGKALSKAEDDRLKQIFSERIESYLDAGAGECWMKDPVIADLVENALKYFDQQRYNLFGWCVMPNHVHVVVQPYPAYELSDIEHSWKSYTAHEANKRLRRSGVFWQPEPYDHLIRDEEDLNHAIEYILANPKASGLYNWRWVGISQNISEILNRGTGVPPVGHGRDGHATSRP